MIKLILFLIISIILTGCNVSYNLNINEYLEVEELIISLEDNDALEQEGINKYTRVEYILNVLNQTGELISYNKETIYNKATSGVRVRRNFNNINDYKETSTINKEIFANFNIVENNQKITISAITNPVTQNIGDNLINVDVINIKIPYANIKHNADIVNNNIYTWYLVNNQPRNINITYATNSKYRGNRILDNILNNIWLYLFAIIICSLIGGVVLWFANEKRRNNSL